MFIVLYGHAIRLDDACSIPFYLSHEIKVLIYTCIPYTHVFYIYIFHTQDHEVEMVHMAQQKPLVTEVRSLIYYVVNPLCYTACDYTQHKYAFMTLMCVYLCIYRASTGRWRGISAD